MDGPIRTILPIMPPLTCSALIAMADAIASAVQGDMSAALNFAERGVMRLREAIDQDEWQQGRIETVPDVSSGVETGAGSGLPG